MSLYSLVLILGWVVVSCLDVYVCIYIPDYVCVFVCIGDLYSDFICERFFIFNLLLFC